MALNVLRVKVNADTQPVALALIEAKKESLPPGHGLDQAKGYSECRRLQVKFVFSSNGHRTPEGLLDIIEAKGREVAEALAVLRVRG